MAVCAASIIVFVALLLGLPADEVSKDELLAGLRQSEDTLRSFSVTSRFEAVNLFGIPSTEQGAADAGLDMAAVGADEPFHDRVKYWIGTLGRARCECDGVAFANTASGSRARRKSVAVFDGNETRKMEGESQPTGGRVSPGVARVFEHADPRNFVTHFFDKPVSAILEEDGFTIVGPSVWDGRAVLRVETEPTVGVPGIEAVEEKEVFLIDVAHGFSVVRKALVFRFPPEKWVERCCVEMHETVRDASGLWLPRRIRWESFGLPVKAGVNPLPLWRWDVANENWAVNPELPESLFTLRFEAGTFVNDDVAGSSYQVAAVTDQSISDSAALAKRIGAQNGARSGRTLIIANLLAVAIVLVAISVRALRRRRKK